jgi:hypothetical protein
VKYEMLLYIKFISALIYKGLKMLLISKNECTNMYVSVYIYIYIYYIYISLNDRMN